VTTGDGHGGRGGWSGSAWREVFCGVDVRNVYLIPVRGTCEVVQIYQSYAKSLKLCDKIKFQQMKRWLNLK